MKKFSVFLCSIVLIISLGVPAGASLITYTDRSSWEAAVGGIFSEETFNGITTDTDIPQYSNTLAIGSSFELQYYGNDPGAQFNLIDASPFISTSTDPNLNVNGTTYLRGAVVAGSSATRMGMIFNTPILAWGADFVGATDGGHGVQLFLQAAPPLPWDASPVTTNVINDDGFFGFISTDAFSFVGFQAGSTGGEGFGMDNVVSSAVPEPATMLLLGSGLLGLAVIGRRKFFKK